MTPLTTQTRMTADEFFDWANRPENRDRHFELERGEVVERSRPGELHGYVCLNIGRILGNYVFQRRKGYACSNDTGLILERDPDTVRGPDIVLYEESRRHGQLNPRYSEQPPTLAVEVLSPNDKWPKVTRRVTNFLNHGVKLIWVVDPETCSVTVHQAGRLAQVFEGTDELTGGDVLPDLRLRVADLFLMPGEEGPPPPVAPA
jgi:Uma2 family endonuclease